jgi:acetyl-CoA C-acetyltransferase
MKTDIIGWAHTKFGKHDARSVESLITEVVANALADAEIDASEVDEIFVGQFNSGLDPQAFPSSLPMQGQPGLRFKPSTHVENACATGSAAILQGIRSIQAGEARVVLVVGVEKMSGLPTKEVGKVLLSAGYDTERDVEGGFAGIFAQIADAYFEAYGDNSEAMARIAAKNHRNGSKNPLAQIQKDLGFDFCNTVSDQNPIVAGSLRRTDCSMVSDGAAAVVLATDDVSRTAGKAIRFRAANIVNDYLPMQGRDIIRFEGGERAWSQALQRGGVTLQDLDLMETHDCFTIAELIEYEMIGLTPRGKGRMAIEEGWTEMGGRLPVNPSGGLKAKGHPIGATGVSMHVLSAMQLMGQAGGIQVKDAKIAGIFNMGGTAVSNYASILERHR